MPEGLYFRIMGRLIRVVRIATTINEANGYMLAHPGTSLLAAIDNNGNAGFTDNASLYLLANSNDKGN